MQRKLEWDGCINARDLGGYPTKDGRTTCWGAVLRSDHLGSMRPAGQAALRVQGIRSIIDLRLPSELLREPHPFAPAGAYGVGYTHISFLDPSIPPALQAASLADGYKRGLDLHRRNVAAIISAIARAPEGGVLIHCTSGKDRTGTIAALLLALVGVPRATIGADYALSEECLRDRTAMWLEHGPGDRAERERQIAWSRPRPNVILEVLEHVDTHYGGVATYLQDAGVTAEDLSRLRERLLNPH